MADWKNKAEKGVNIALFLFIVIWCIAWAIAQERPDNDLWFMLSNGRFLIHGKMNDTFSLFGLTFPTKDPLSMHHWMDYSLEKWLTCLLFYGLYQIGGTKLLVAFSSVMAFLFASLYARTAKVRCKTWTAPLFLSACTMALLLPRYFTTRPQIFTYVSFLLVIDVLLRQEGSWKQVVFLPLLSFVEMQFHSTQWVILFVPVAFAVLFRKDKKQTVLSGVLMFLVGFLNPYGARSVFYIFHAVGHAYMDGIGECRPVQNVLGLSFILLVFSMAVVFFFGKKLDLKDFLFLSFLSVFALSAYRNLPYLWIASVLLAEPIENTPRKVKAVLFVMLPCLALSTVLHSRPGLNKDIIATQGIRYVKDHAEPEDAVYTDFNCGGYAEWLGLHPYIDPRAEVFFSSLNGGYDVYSEWSTTKIKDLVKKYHFDWIVSIGKCPKGYEQVFVDGTDGDTYYVYKKMK